MKNIIKTFIDNNIDRLYIPVPLNGRGSTDYHTSFTSLSRLEHDESRLGYMFDRYFKSNDIEVYRDSIELNFISTILHNLCMDTKMIVGSIYNFPIYLNKIYIINIRDDSLHLDIKRQVYVTHNDVKRKESNIIAQDISIRDIVNSLEKIKLMLKDYKKHILMISHSIKKSYHTKIRNLKDEKKQLKRLKLQRDKYVTSDHTCKSRNVDDYDVLYQRLKKRINNDIDKVDINFKQYKKETTFLRTRKTELKCRTTLIAWKELLDIVNKK